MPVLIIAFSAAARLSCTAAADKRILVLGLQSPLMDEVQERYLRECLLRRLVKKGCSVITVMEMEEMRGEDLSQRLTALSPEEIREKALKYNAHLVVYGSIGLADRTGTDGMSEKEKYLCDLNVMEVPSAKVKNFRHTVRGQRDWLLFSDEMAGILADDVAGMDR